MKSFPSRSVDPARVEIQTRHLQGETPLNIGTRPPSPDLAVLIKKKTQISPLVTQVLNP